MARDFNVGWDYIAGMMGGNPSATGSTTPTTTAATGAPGGTTTTTAGGSTVGQQVGAGTYAPWNGGQTATQQGTGQSQYYGAATANDPRLNVINSQLAGQVNPDVLANIYQAGAERGITTGGAGSANANAAMLRALGQTSAGLQQQGVQNVGAMYNSYAQLNPTAANQMSLEDYLTRVREDAATGRTAMSNDTQVAIANLRNMAEMNQQQAQQAFQAAQNAIQRDMTMTMQERQFANQMAQREYESYQQQQSNMAYQRWLNSIQSYGQGNTASNAGGGGGSNVTNLDYMTNDEFQNFLYNMQGY